MSPFGSAFTRHFSILTKLACLALVLFAATPAKAQIPVQFGDTITEPGVYFLHGNQTGSGSSGIAIESDDVTLLLLRFTLRGDGSYIGISSIGNDNVTIYGGRVTRFSRGIVITEGEGCTVKDVRIDHCNTSGLVAFEMVESWFLRLRCDCNGTNGVEATGCERSRFLSILAHDNDANGLVLGDILMLAGTNSGNNKVKLCWAANNDVDGIKIQNSQYDEVVRNQCVHNGAAGIHLDSFFEHPETAASQAAEGPHDVDVTSNWCVFNHEGIVLDENARSNTLTNNTSLANFGHDMIDDNLEPPCQNTWFLNFFFSRDGAGEDCIF